MPNDVSDRRWSLGLLGGVRQDLRLALRMLIAYRHSSLLTVMVLSVGIGVNTAAFTAAKAWFIRPFPFPEPERLVRLEGRDAAGGLGAHYLDFLDWRQRNRVFEDIAIIITRSPRALSMQAGAERVPAYATTAGALRVLGATPIVGRYFTEHEDAPGAEYVALMTESTWRGRFGARPDVLGSPVVLDGRTYTILGIMPDDAAIPGAPRPAFWVPLREDPSGPRVGQQYYGLMARLRPDVTLSQARANMDEIARQLQREHPESNQDARVSVVSAQSFIRDKAALPVAGLFAVSGCVLLLVCLNITSLLLARAASRTKDTAIRSALGASRYRIFRHLFLESAALATLGGTLGLLIAIWLLDLADGLMPTRGFAETLRLDPPVLLFTLGTCMLVAGACSVLPALMTSTSSLDRTLKNDGAIAGRYSRQRFLSVTTVLQVSLSMSLLVGAAVLVTHFIDLLDVDTGLKTDGVLTFQLELSRRRIAAPEDATAFVRRLTERLRSQPMIETVAAIRTLPMSSYKTETRFAIGQPQVGAADRARAILNASTPGYFRALRIPVLQGRDFNDQDETGTAPVAIVNDELVRRWFRGRTPLGETVTLASGPARSVVGVVGSVRHDGPQVPAVPEIYLPLTQNPEWEVFFVVRSLADSSAVAGVLRQNVHDLDRDLPVEQLRSMEQVVEDSLAQPRLLARLLTGFALFGIALALTGIYSVIANWVAQRRRELAVRVAVGASTWQLLRMVLAHGFTLGGFGVGLGAPLSFGVSQGMGVLLSHAGGGSLIVIGFASCVVLAIALAATYVAARGVMRLQPTAVLRQE